MKRILSLALTLPLTLLFAAGAHGETGVIQQIFSFPCPNTLSGVCADGYQPNVLIQASDGNFYGAAQLTTFGTSNPQGGTLFKVTPSGQFTLLFTFKADSHGNYLNGNNPASGLLEANDGFLYGTTFEGGASNNGVLFRISKTGTGFAVVHNFCSAASCADGNLPTSLILGHDGNLYGVTVLGGSSSNNCIVYGGCGTIYRFSPPSTFKTLFEFEGGSEGADPTSLIQGSDGKFYGTNGPNVFRFTSGGQLSPLITLPKVNGILPTNTDGGLVQASNGVLYGPLITYSVNQAQFYEIHTSGAGFQEFPQIGTLEIDFSISSLIQASDGNLWTAFNEQSANDGIVIAMSPVDGSIVRQFQFDGTNGATPLASVVQGADGKIYGTAIAGGAVGNGKVASGTVWNLDAGLPAPKPAVPAFIPVTGTAGAKVMIRGDHFVGTTKVNFNGVSAAFQVLNVHFIEATVPAGATSGPISVTNAGGKTTTVKSFTVQ